MVECSFRFKFTNLCKQTAESKNFRQYSLIYGSHWPKNALKLLSYTKSSKMHIGEKVYKFIAYDITNGL